ncbi:hypothetical protein UPYG_G00276020 [Umbra pygmaea]|uniref:ELM2 and SANT domain-containing protein 1-like n=1 Tax=Umbra pygmaea TaxID=75934 RepID=A0ABD0W3Z4_UMBPY
MSLPPQQKIVLDKGGSKPRAAAAMKEATMQNCGDDFYDGIGPPDLESAHGAREPGRHGSGLFNPEKGPQSQAHYQQTSSAKWIHQDSNHGPGWSQEAPMSTNPWGQSIGQYSLNHIRAQMVFPKGNRDGGAAVQMGPEKHGLISMDAQAHNRGLEWEQQARRKAQLQAYQQGPKGVEPPVHSAHATLAHPSIPPGSMMHTFQQLPFRPTNQHLPAGYYPVYQGGTKAMTTLSYSEQPKAQQHPLIQLRMQQQHQMQQQQQQQMQQHHQQQQQQQQQLQHQMQQIQLQQQMQQYQKHQQQQQMHRLLQQPHSLPLQETLQSQSQQPNQHFLSYNPDNCPSSASPPPTQQDKPQSVEAQGNTVEVDTPSTDPASTPSDPGLQKDTADPMSPCSDTPLSVPRRSRRLSKDGLSPLPGPPPQTPWSQTSRDVPQNGVVSVAGGVIKSTQRRRRQSKEINLETLAQKASERESLPPAKVSKLDDMPAGRQAGMGPLVIPVSVPVRQGQTIHPGTWPQGRPPGRQNLIQPQPEQKTSVIVPCRRSLRTSLSESSSQDGEGDPGPDDDGKSVKQKRRPRPERLIIPLPKAATFIAPSVYSAITPYQSHLRSPVRLPDHTFTMPPYTPPPILSPAREGSGLYFSAFLSSIAAGNQTLQPPPITPKSTPRSLLRSASSDISPPTLPLITDATPVSFEPRINIGPQYQAEVPDLQQDQSLSQLDQHKADLVWLPLTVTQLSHAEQVNVDNLMNLSCSSVLNGGGTNQELALHCLHECGGNVLEALAFLLLKEPLFPKGHQLADYHYSGSDFWTPSEKHFFNKGISAYRKDFFLVQKLVRTKTVQQCVEFYYTYKKQVKIGRSGTLTYGPHESPAEKQNEEVVDVKSSQRSKPTQEELDEWKWVQSCDQGQDGSQFGVPPTLPGHGNQVGATLGRKDHDTGIKGDPPPPTVAPRKTRPESAVRKSKAPPKPSQEPEGNFPCKKCSRVFGKVKSRSAHMKSHAEREKKEAALKLKEEEERKAVAARAREAAAASQNGNGGGGGARDPDEVSDEDVPSEAEDQNDEDWH